MVLRWIKENCLDEELLVYYMESLGSKDRLDYGTGHELSFVGFLLVCEALQCWHRTDSPELLEENDPRMKECRFVILIIFRTYLQLIRRLQKRFRLEPAGSHGVWGLDDHQFLPYIFGSAQLIGK